MMLEKNPFFNRKIPKVIKSPFFKVPLTEERIGVIFVFATVLIVSVIKISQMDILNPKISQEALIKNFQTKQETAVMVGKPVEWAAVVNKKSLQGKKDSIQIPLSAGNIKIELAKLNSDATNYLKQNITLSDRKELAQMEGGSFFAKFVQQQLMANLSGFFRASLYDVKDKLNNQLVETKQGKVVNLKDAAKKTSADENYVAVKYETPAPQATARDLAMGKEITISGAQGLIYSNVLAYTRVAEIYAINEKQKIEVLDKVTQKQVDFQAYDLNNNGKIDYVEWNIPSLGSDPETYSLIYLTKATLLDKNKNILKDVYLEVKTKDNLWQLATDGQTIRVVFNQPLSPKNDITIYVRNPQRSSTKVEIYYSGTSQKIKEFPIITDEKYYKVLLTEMIGRYDSFDLKIKNNDNNAAAYLEFDHILDPDCSALGDCNSHGTCQEGDTCLCDSGWADPDCADCNSSSVCSAGQICSSGTCAGCAVSGDCTADPVYGAGYFCGTDTLCHNTCVEDNDCESGYYCDGTGGCSAGSNPGSGAACSGSSTSCIYGETCRADELCHAGALPAPGASCAAGDSGCIYTEWCGDDSTCHDTVEPISGANCSHYNQAECIWGESCHSNGVCGSAVSPGAACVATINCVWGEWCGRTSGGKCTSSCTNGFDDIDCPVDTPVCNSNVCYAGNCYTYANCTGDNAGKICTSYTCSVCSLEADCTSTYGAGYWCDDDGDTLCKNTCTDGLAAAECPSSKPVCESNACYAGNCILYSDCTGANAGKICTSHSCSTCSTNVDCTGTYGELYWCATGGAGDGLCHDSCTLGYPATECAGVEPVCSAGCNEGNCYDNSDCIGYVCNAGTPDFYCKTSCASDSDCITASGYWCGTDTECHNSCAVNDDCGSGYWCGTDTACHNSCAEDNDCGSGYWCDTDNSTCQNTCEDGTSSANCPSATKPVCESNACYAGNCILYSDCTGANAGKICTSHSCSACSTDVNCNSTYGESYVCSGGLCVVPVCGNGVIETGETCDDGDTDAGDGCSATCQTETNWTCEGTPSVCTCTADGACPGGWCGGDGACHTTCTNGISNTTECTALKPVCESNVCYAGNCISGSNCTAGNAGKYCASHACTACSTDSNCTGDAGYGAGYWCDDGDSLCKNTCENGPTSTNCTTAKPVCDTNACYEGNCRVYSDCAGGNAGKICTSHNCVACSTDANCTGAYGAGYWCGSNNICNNTCTSGVNNTTECPAAKPVCVSNVCNAGDCVTYSDCAAGKLCTNYTCSACSENSNCTDIYGAGYWCGQDSSCYNSCLSDTDCELGKTCQAGDCALPVVSSAGSGSGASASFTSTLPSPVAPAEGFKVQINNGSQYTENREVLLTFVAGSDTTTIDVSTSSNFTTNTKEVAFNSSYVYDLCPNATDCPEGDYTVYVKFLNSQGGSSSVVSSTIRLGKATITQQVVEQVQNIPNVIASEAQNITSQIFQLRSQMSEILKPRQTQELILPPVIESVPQQAPAVFNGQLGLLPSEPLDQFVLAPMPESVQNLIKEFPKFGQTLQESGITSASGLEGLRVSAVNLPGLTETLGMPVSSQGTPVAEFTLEQKEKIPSDVVFAKTSNGFVDINTKVSIDDKGVLQQNINTISGQALQLIVKPANLANDVQGYIIFKSRTAKPMAKNSISLELLTASLLFAKPEIANAAIEEENALYLKEFTYKDIGGGVFTAEVSLPAIDGEYEIKTIINYKNQKESPKEIRMLAVIDPEGYVFEKLGVNEIRIKGAKITLYWLNPVTKNYEVWPAQNFQQQNPQTTDEKGTYSFLVTPGSYYLKIEAPGYNAIVQKPFDVSEGSAIHFNVEVSAKYWWLKPVYWETILLAIILLIFFFNMFRDKMQKHFSNSNVSEPVLKNN